VTVFDLLFLFPALIILVTAVARLNDIKRDQRSPMWWARRVGLGATSVGMLMFLASFFAEPTRYWNETMKLAVLWGFALTWITTPNMVPWYKYITRFNPHEEDAHK
jgi:hypothetical protein